MKSLTTFLVLLAISFSSLAQVAPSNDQKTEPLIKNALSGMKQKRKVDKVRLLWDVSYSMKDRDLEKEFEYLDNYFDYFNFKDLEVETISFSNEIIEKKVFSVKKGEWAALKSFLKSSVYDGGTSFDALMDMDSSMDEVLLFTDGMATLSNLPESLRKRIYVINSKDVANHEGNKLLGNSWNGAYVNLSDTNIDGALEAEQLRANKIEKTDTKGKLVTVTGTIKDERQEPLPGVDVVISGKSKGTQTDINGDFSIDVQIGQELEFSYYSYEPVNVRVRNSRKIDMVMTQASNALGVVVIYGNSKPIETVSYPVTTISQEEIENKPESDIVRSLIGKVAGAQITGTSGASGSGTKFTIRSQSSINGDNQPLFVVDGVPFDAGTNSQTGFAGGSLTTSSRFLDLDPNNVESVKILKGLSAAVLYGQQGRNGVVLITTKSGSAYSRPPAELLSEEYLEDQKKRRQELNSQKTIDEKRGEIVYLNELKSIGNTQGKYNQYLEQRKQYGNSVDYFVGIYDYMRKFDLELANRILSNIAEIEINNSETLKVFAFKLEEQGNYNLAVQIYRRIAELREYDTASSRDLALALSEVGEHRKALELLIDLAGRHDNSESNEEKINGLESIARNEIWHIIHRSDILKEYGNMNKTLDAYDMDLRVVIDWNKSDTDLDLFVVDPNLEECHIDYSKTKTGGELFAEINSGYGPEEFNQKQVNTGSYYIKLNSTANSKRIIDEPTFVKLTVYRNYGRANQSKEIKVIPLPKKIDKELLQRIAIL